MKPLALTESMFGLCSPTAVGDFEWKKKDIFFSLPFLKLINGAARGEAALHHDSSEITSHAVGHL